MRDYTKYLHKLSDLQALDQLRANEPAIAAMTAHEARRASVASKRANVRQGFTPSEIAWFRRPIGGGL